MGPSAIRVRKLKVHDLYFCFRFCFELLCILFMGRLHHEFDICLYSIYCYGAVLHCIYLSGIENVYVVPWFGVCFKQSASKHFHSIPDPMLSAIVEPWRDNAPEQTERRLVSLITERSEKKKFIYNSGSGVRIWLFSILWRICVGIFTADSPSAQLRRPQSLRHAI